MEKKSGRKPGFFNHSSDFTGAQLDDLRISFRERGLLRGFVSNKDFVTTLYNKAVDNFNEISTNGKLADPTKKITVAEYAVLYDLADLAKNGLSEKAANNEFPGLPDKINKCREMVAYYDKHPDRLREMVAVETPKIKATLSPR
jgi:hypothetical protein